jgi:DivIVA domain-containing protein
VSTNEIDVTQPVFVESEPDPYLTGDEVAARDFPYAMRGFAREEVQDFLRHVADEIDDRDGRASDLVANVDRLEQRTLDLRDGFVAERDRLLAEIARRDDTVAELTAELERPESERLMKAYGTEIARMLENAETTANKVRDDAAREAESRTTDARREAEEVRTSALNAAERMTAEARLQAKEQLAAAGEEAVSITRVAFEEADEVRTKTRALIDRLASSKHILEDLVEKVDEDLAPMADARV